MPIYAKIQKDQNWNILRFEDIYQHTYKVLKYAFENIYDDDLKVVSKITKWPKEKIKEAIFFAAFFHDIGKITKQFQDTILWGKKSYHAYYSMAIYYNLAKNWNFDYLIFDDGWDKDYEDIVLLAIWTHHSSLKEWLYTEKKDQLQFDVLTDQIKSFLKQLPIWYKEFLNTDFLYQFNFNWITKDFYHHRAILARIDNYNYQSIQEYFKLKMLYGYIAWILNIWDWLASADFDQALPKIKFDNKPVLNFSFKLKPFQQKLSHTFKNVLVEIPTGEWKTEWALLWAVKNRKWNFNKIIYTLPTQVTSNKMYQRLVNLFGEENVGLVHSSAELFLQDFKNIDKDLKNQTSVEEETQEIDLYLAEKNFNKLFSKPITISTLDAVLKFFINMWRWPIAQVNKLNALLIIDEIHTYDWKLSWFLANLIQSWVFEDLGIKLAILSASFPQSKKEAILWQSWKQNFEVVTQPELFNVAPNKIELIEDKLDDNLFSILQKSQWKNVLIVRNTVKHAFFTYQKLAEVWYNVMLYHSRFKKIDKKLKEFEIFYRLGKEKLKKFDEEIILDGKYTPFEEYISQIKPWEKFILVATQVVEISLDIDFDIMLTDIAPLDALIQRFWRVNRKKLANKQGQIYIFGKYEKINGHYPYEDFLLDTTFEHLKNWSLSLAELNQILDKIYSLFLQSVEGKDRVFDSFGKWKELFWKKMEQLKGIFKGKEYDIRDINQEDIDVFLRLDYEKAVEQDQKLDKKHLLPLAIWYVKKFLTVPPDKSSKLYYPVVNIDYDFKYWVNPWKEKSELEGEILLL